MVPGKSATGTNTAMRTSEVAITTPVTSFIAAEVASITFFAPSSRCRSTFSITTIASSTTRPVANVSPNKVRVLIEKPKARTKMKVPTSETGMVIAGITVERQV